MRLALPVLVLLLALPAAACGSGTAHASFVFGRTGGNIAPFRVSIARDGAVSSRGAIRKASLVRRVPGKTLDKLLAQARAASFFALPSHTYCRNSLPDVASMLLRVSTSARSKTVTVRGGCRPRFSKLYRAVRAAALR
jgi:hypothetical protein